jgi:hypothetical protein
MNNNTHKKWNFPMIKFQQIEKLWLNSYIYGKTKITLLNIFFEMEFNDWKT